MRQTLGYDANNRLAAVKGVTYDEMGNVTVENNPLFTYSYEAENRVVSESGGSASETYVYDAIGRRVKRNYSGTSVSYYYDLQGHAVAMFGPSDQYLAGEMFLGNMHLATHNGRTYFSHTNLVGSTRVTTNETGAVYNNCTWWPFGDQQSCAAGPATDIGYAGMQRDAETGLDHTWFRYYNSRLGRWMSADPLSGSIGNPQSLNRFAYVLNNPANLVDPFGLEDCVQASDGSWVKKDGTPCTASGDPDNLNLIPGGSVTVNGGDGESNHNPMNEPAGSVSWDGNWHCFDEGACVYTGGSAGGGAPCLNGAGPLLPDQTRCGDAANNGTPQQATKTQERLERLKNCALGYYGIDPLSISGATSNGAKWGLIALSAGGIPKSVAANMGLRAIMQPGASEYTSAFSMLSLATGGGGALRSVANFGSKWALPIAIASAVIDATAMGICTASD